MRVDHGASRVVLERPGVAGCGDGGICDQIARNRNVQDIPVSGGRPAGVVRALGLKHQRLCMARSPRAVTHAFAASISWRKTSGNEIKENQAKDQQGRHSERRRGRLSHTREE